MLTLLGKPYGKSKTRHKAPATRALVAAGYTELRQLAGVPIAELRALHGMGPRALARLQEALDEEGLSLV